MNTTKTRPPTVDWLDFQTLSDDPLSAYERLRDSAPVAWAPQLQRYVAVGFDDVSVIDRDGDAFEPDQEPRSKHKRAMGPTLITKSDPEHAAEREVINPSLRPRVAQQEWAPAFRRNLDGILADFERRGPGADLVSELAVPYSAANLATVVGLPGAAPADVARWSTDFIAAAGNHQDVPEVWERGDRSSAEVDALIDEAIPYLTRNPDASMLSAMARSDLPLELVRANTKLAISGGVNEPQHTLVNGVWAFDRHPAQLAELLEDPARFAGAFEEVVRWLSPITALARRARRDVELSGVLVPEGSYLFALIWAANRDPERFDRPDSFDIDRARTTHLAFGSGTHMCAGSWVARVAVGHVAWPTLYQRLAGLRPIDPDAARWHGFVFRGIESLPVTWGGRDA